MRRRQLSRKRFPRGRHFEGSIVFSGVEGHNNTKIHMCVCREGGTESRRVKILGLFFSFFFSRGTALSFVLVVGVAVISLHRFVSFFFFVVRAEDLGLLTKEVC